MDTIEKLLDLVQNADLFTKRVQELKAEQTKLIQLIETHAKVADVDRIVSAAKHDREEAVAVLEAAQARYKEVIQQATKEATKIVSEAEKTRTSLNQQMSEVERVRKDLQMEIESLNSKRKQVNSDLQMAAELKKEVEAEMLEVKAKHDKLKAALS